MSVRWRDRIWQGHLSFWRVTTYGANAMLWAINFRGNRNYFCFHPTTRTFGGYWPWKFYISQNATPWAAVWGCGPGFDGPSATPGQAKDGR